MRPIDAEHLTKWILSWWEQTSPTSEYLKGADILAQIDREPTIEAVSVVRGEWTPNPQIGWGETWVCSICGEKTTSSIVGKPRYNFCPNCGAKMKGADDE